MHYVPWVSYVRVRWIDPDGSVVRGRATPDGVYLTDALTERGGAGARRGDSKCCSATTSSTSSRSK
jgi:hypothetical protein